MRYAEITTRAKLSSREGIIDHKFMVFKDAVRVWDSNAGRFVRCNSLSKSDEKRIHSLVTVPVDNLRQETKSSVSGKRMMISCHAGLAPISVPAEWLQNFDPGRSFASVRGDGRIRFPNGRAWSVSIKEDGHDVTPVVRELSKSEIRNTRWGVGNRPWEPSSTARAFGHGPVAHLE